MLCVRTRRLFFFFFFCFFFFFVAIIVFFFFFFNDTATTEIYTLSLHDALPISRTKKYFIVLLKMIKGVQVRKKIMVTIQSVEARRLLDLSARSFASHLCLWHHKAQ